MTMQILSLAHPLNADAAHGPVSAGFEHKLTFPHAPFDAGTPKGPDLITSASDWFSMGTHTGTHIDSLSHISIGGGLVDGTTVLQAETEDGVALASKPALSPLYCKAVLIDLPTYFGVDMVPGDLLIDSLLIQQVATSQASTLAEGKAILIRTGRDTVANDSSAYLGLPIPGVETDLAHFMVTMKAPCVGTDTMPFESAPAFEKPLEVHAILIAQAGIPIMENLNLKPLSDLKKYEFDLVVAPLPISNATGSPVNPLALFNN